MERSDCYEGKSRQFGEVNIPVEQDNHQHPFHPLFPTVSQRFSFLGQCFWPPKEVIHLGVRVAGVRCQLPIANCQFIAQCVRYFPQSLILSSAIYQCFTPPPSKRYCLDFYTNLRQLLLTSALTLHFFTTCFLVLRELYLFFI